MSFTSKLFSPFSRKEENTSGDAENVREELKNFIGVRIHIHMPIPNESDPS